MASRGSPPTLPPAPPPPAVELQSCPIGASLGTFGRKWTLTILRDIAWTPGVGFNAILRSNPGLRPRTLSLRLRQLTSEGLIQRDLKTVGGRRAHYHLTDRGREVWPVLAALAQFGMRNRAEVVFADGQPRDLQDVYPDSADLMLDRLAPYARSTPPVLPRGTEPAAATGVPRAARAR